MFYHCCGYDKTLVFFAELTIPVLFLLDRTKSDHEGKRMPRRRSSQICDYQNLEMKIKVGIEILFI